MKKKLLIALGAVGLALCAWWGWTMIQARDRARILELEHMTYAQACRPPLSDELRHISWRGNAKAPGFVGMCFQMGIGRPADINEAEKWYRLAAKRGDRLGNMELKAMEKCRDELQAAIGGQIEAQTNVAYCYWEGTSMTADIVEAEKWFRLAAKRGDDRSKMQLKLIEDCRDELQAANRGQKEAQAKVGRCYWDGTGMRKDHVETEKWNILAGIDRELYLSDEENAEAKKRASSWRPIK